MAVRILFLLAMTALAGCGANGPEKSIEQPTSVSVIEPKRTRRGNPPFYEVMGQRYYVAASSDGYRERGVASWYGQKFHGLPTASGELFDMHKLTAAHKTLPIPTWVQVTNLSNGETVIVKVNDRGPFVDNRLIDLSYGAAQALDMVRAGTSLVEVRALGAPAAAPAQVTARSAAPPDGSTPGPQALPGEPLYLQVGAFGDQTNALRLVERLETEGFKDVFVMSLADVRPALHRVRIGPIQSVARFDALLGQLAALGLGDARLVTLD